MPKYRVEFPVRKTVVEIVEAKDEDAAIDKATAPYEEDAGWVPDIYEVEKYTKFKAREKSEQKKRAKMRVHPEDDFGTEIPF